MLLGVSIGAGFVGFCLIVAGWQKWSFTALLSGRWAVQPGAAAGAGGAIPTTPYPTHGGPPYGPPVPPPAPRYHPPGTFPQK